MKGWVGLVGWPIDDAGRLTYISGHPSAAGRAWNRKVRRSKTNVLTTVPRNQPVPRFRLSTYVLLGFFSRWPHGLELFPSYGTRRSVQTVSDVNLKRIPVKDDIVAKNLAKNFGNVGILHLDQINVQRVMFVVSQILKPLHSILRLIFLEFVQIQPLPVQQDWITSMTISEVIISDRHW